MQEIIIDPCLEKDSEGNPALRMLVQGREVLAVFSSEKNSTIGAQLKQTLLDSYLNGINNENIA